VEKREWATSLSKEGSSPFRERGRETIKHPPFDNEPSPSLYKEKVKIRAYIIILGLKH